MKKSLFFVALCATLAAVSSSKASAAAGAGGAAASQTGSSKGEGDITVLVERIPNGDANDQWKFKNVPAMAKTNAATKAKFTLVSGEQDGNGAGLEALHDGKLPSGEDVPEENFFFNAGTDGGRIGIDLTNAIDIKQINSYSWHPNTRGPQVYKLYASDGTAEGFKARPETGDPAKAGWKLLASVDTRPKGVEAGDDYGGQYGVSISSASGLAGHYRYLLFDCATTERDKDDFGNTFYSEITVIAK
jgi:hypothetical protein